MSNLLRHSYRALELLMAAILFAMMVLTAVDVVGRYLFGAPVPGGFEMVQYMMAFVIFASLPLTTRNNSHLTVSLMSEALSGRGRRVHDLFVLLVSALAVFVIAWRVTAQGDAQARAQQISGFLRIPLHWVSYGMSVFAWLTLAILFAMIVGVARGGGRHRGSGGSVD